MHLYSLLDSGGSNSPLGMSMLRNARSGGRFLNHDWRSTPSIEVVKDGDSTLKAIHPAEHPSTPATNNYCSLRLVTSSNAGQRRQKNCVPPHSSDVLEQ